jgi:hypothetical protein
VPQGFTSDLQGRWDYDGPGVIHHDYASGEHGWLMSGAAFPESWRVDP